MSSWPSATGTPIAVSSRTGRCSGPVCGSLTKPSPARFASPARRSSDGRGVEADRAGVVGDAAADQAVLEHRGREHLGGAQATRRPRRRRASPPGARGRPRARTSGARARGPPRRCARSTGCRRRRRRRGPPPRGRSCSAPGSRSRPSCGNATTWRSTTPRNSSRSASSGITPSSRAVGVDVGEGEHVAYAVPHRLEHRLRAFALDPGAVVVGLDRRGELDGVQRRAHVAGGVRRQRGVADPVERVDLVEVHVAVGEALRRPARRPRRSPSRPLSVSRSTALIRPVVDADLPAAVAARAASRRRRPGHGWARVDSIGPGRRDHGTVCRRTRRSPATSASARVACRIRRRVRGRCRCRPPPGR